MNQSYIFGGNTGLSYDQIQKQRDIANELLRANMSTPQNVGEGLSAIGRALAAKAIDKRTSRADEANRQASQARRADAFGMIFGGGSGGSGAPFSPNVTPAAPPSPGADVADATMTALGKTPMRPFRDAIASIESDGSGGYAAVGPTHPQLGRALGRYQIMEANIGPWSREVLGREVTPEEFMANPQIQDAIFDGKFGGYVQQFGPEGAAQAWFAGPGGVGKMDRQDSLGTSVAEYTQKFSSALGGAPAPSGNMGNPATIQVIADLLADPYTPPGEKAMLEQAMAMQLQGMDPMRQLEMEKARLELDQLRNPQPGFTTLTDEQEAQMGLDTSGLYQQDAEGRLYTVQEPTKPAEDPTAVREYNFYAQQEQAAGRPVKSFDEWKKGNAKAGASSTTVVTGENSSAFAKKTDEAAAARFDGYVQAGANANKMMGDINALVALAPMVGTGKEAEIRVKLGPIAEAFGIDVDGLGEAEAFQSIVDRMAPQMRTPGAGSSSDFDARQFLSSLPQLGRSPEGNKIITQTLAAVQQYQIAAAELASRSFLPTDDPNFLTWQEAEKQIRALGDPYSTFNEFKKSMPKEEASTTEEPADELSAEERAYLGLE